jgi:hypothetical protein
MNLPTSAEVNAATRHIGSFAAGAIAMFGLSSKFDPSTVQQIIAASGNVINDVIILIGLVGPFITAYFASKSATPAAQAVSLEKQGAIVVTSPEIAAATPNSPNVISNTEVKVVPK